MRNDDTDLLVVALTATAAAVVLLLTGLVASADPVKLALQIVAGVPLALVLPGYALRELVVPLSRGRDTPPVRMLLVGIWSVGLSLAVTVFAGLVLNLTPSGLDRTNWTVLLATLTLLATGGALFARRRASAPRSAARGRVIRMPQTSRELRSVCLGAAALGAVVVAVWLAHSSAAGQRTAGFAQLWLTPSTATTSTSGPGQAVLGVRNDQHAAESFRLELRSGGAAPTIWSVTLAAGEVWRQPVSMTPGQQLRAELTGPSLRGPQTVVLSPATTARNAGPNPAAAQGPER